MSFFLLSWGKVILERMSFGLWIVSYFVTFKVQATAVKLQSVATPVLHESPMPAPATGSDGLTLCDGKPAGSHTSRRLLLTGPILTLTNLFSVLRYPRCYCSPRRSFVWDLWHRHASRGSCVRTRPADNAP